VRSSQRAGHSVSLWSRAAVWLSAPEARLPSRSTHCALTQSLALTTLTTVVSARRPVPIRPPLAIGRSSGPVLTLEASSHARTAFTGQATEPQAIAMVSPAPSWPVFKRRMCTRIPPSQNSRSVTSRATSSERRKAPAKPSNKISKSAAGNAGTASQASKVVTAFIAINPDTNGRNRGQAPDPSPPSSQ
jgi:hypothetical protein